MIVNNNNNKIEIAFPFIFVFMFNLIFDFVCKPGTESTK